ncbi:hypothetical protein [Streptomyces sp. NPDC050485]|uniref:hypothetical protein n=1 Tax=Streptomyces sp. NPDC050485 TaxID=3365617 RepID=UPI0037A9686E
MPTRASLTVITPSSHPSANTAPRETGAMPSSSATSLCAPATAPASSAATRLSASLAGTPWAARSTNSRSRALVPAVWYWLTLCTESLLSARSGSVDSW